MSVFPACPRLVILDEMWTQESVRLVGVSGLTGGNGKQACVSGNKNAPNDFKVKKLCQVNFIKIGLGPYFHATGWTIRSPIWTIQKSEIGSIWYERIVTGLADFETFVSHTSSDEVKSTDFSI